MSDTEKFIIPQCENIKDKKILYLFDDKKEVRYITAIYNEQLYIKFCYYNKGTNNIKLEGTFLDKTNTENFIKCLNANEQNFLDKLKKKFNTQSAKIPPL